MTDTTAAMDKDLLTAILAVAALAKIGEST